MSNKIDLRVSCSLDLLRALKQTGAEFAKREDQLVRAISARRYGINSKHRQALQEAGSEGTAKIEQAEEQFQKETERVRGVFDVRQERIERAWAVGVRSLPKRAREAKERWIGDLQMKRFQADRKLASGREACDLAFAEFSAEWNQQRATLGRLELRAKRYLLGFKMFWALRRKVAANANSSPGAPARTGMAAAPLLKRLVEQVQKVDEQLRLFRQFLLPRVFTDLPLPVLIFFLIAGGGIAACAGPNPDWFKITGITGLLIAALVGIHRLASSRSGPAAAPVPLLLAEAAELVEACRLAAESQLERERQALQAEFEQTCAAIDEQWSRADEIEAAFENSESEKLEAQGPRVLGINEAQLKRRLEGIESRQAALVQRIKSTADAQTRQAAATHEAALAQLAADERAEWEQLQTAWQHQITPICEKIDTLNAATAAASPAWSADSSEAWLPSSVFPWATRFGRLEVNLMRDPEAMPKDARLAMPLGETASIPLALTYPAQGSLLFETNEAAAAGVSDALNNIILRLLSTTPPGKIGFTIIDPVGLGQNFAGLMHLADYEENLINRRIWTQRDQIEERLGELCEHAEKVIQMYLRNQYATITEYNEQAGSVAERYQFLVVADFPANFSDTAAKRLLSIAASGPRCGIFTLLHWDQRHPLPDGFVPDDLRKNSIPIRREKNGFILDKAQAEAGALLLLDSPPVPELALRLTHKIGKSSIDSNRVEVPFSQIAPAPEALWSNDTTHELRIPIGRTGATKLQYLAIGKGTRQHALFAGKTGSGKSTLFHVIITNLALACSPEQVEFYLVDFKKGVEFKCYATKRLPHARVVSIESDREFGLSVLQRVDEELKRRGDLFRKLGVQDIAGYKREGGTEPIPRTLLIIDEFQEFFVEDDSISQTASVLFDRLVRQGRAFGIHVLLGSQTLGGAYSLARTTLAQMVIRVALQCNEADAYLIMDEGNSAPRLLSRPGEGIYNDAAGALEGNSPFQVVWLPDEERDEWLDKVHALAEQRQAPVQSPIVFEGNSPADIRENELVRLAIASSPLNPPSVGHAWLGAPNSIKAPTEAAFRRQSGNHLLIVGQREEAALTLLGVSLLALAAQYPPGSAKFVFLDSSQPGSADAEFLERIGKAIPHGLTLARNQEVPSVINDLATELKSRTGGDEPAEHAPTIFLFVNGLHRFKKLRHEDDFSFSLDSSEAGPNPGAQFNELIGEGAAHGIHLLVSIDTLNGVNRFMNRKALSEFEMRVVFQMSANDSASLVDSPNASNLGLHRALFYNEHAGSLETFRPYARPDPEWIDEAARKLMRTPE